MAVRAFWSGGAVKGMAAGLATLLLLFLVNVVAGPGQCTADAVCRLDTDEPTGCAPPPPCDGPGPSWQTTVLVALLVGLAVAFAAVLRERGRRR